MTGAELRSIRESFGLTQREFASAVGLEGSWANATINKMESGKRPVNPLVARCAELMVAIEAYKQERRVRDREG